MFLIVFLAIILALYIVGCIIVLGIVIAKLVIKKEVTNGLGECCVAILLSWFTVGFVIIDPDFI